MPLCGYCPESRRTAKDENQTSRYRPITHRRKDTAQKEIGGTVYTVIGSYDGVETLDRKIERIMGEKFAEKMEDSE